MAPADTNDTLSAQTALLTAQSTLLISRHFTSQASLVIAGQPRATLDMTEYVSKASLEEQL